MFSHSIVIFHRGELDVVFVVVHNSGTLSTVFRFRQACSATNRQRLRQTSAAQDSTSTLDKIVSQDFYRDTSNTIGGAACRN